MQRGKSVIAGLALAAAVCSFALAPSSVWDGVYTEEQAARGLSLYKPECASCHGMALEGAGQFPPLAGDDFKANWNGQQLSDLFEKMRLSMPADHPGKLSAEQNADILAYMLKQNGFPAGAMAMKGDANALKSIRFDSAKPSK
ncbi:MAG: c-type cytochrome [Bryobacteraceae bacterium]|jgi:mono/diheme cytochrome c family protein